MTIMDADGRGRRQFALPDGSRIRFELRNVVSPDGRWLAYFTGSTDEPYDLALNLLSLEDQSTRRIASLIASGFPDTLLPVAETAMRTEYDSVDCPDLPACARARVEQDFLWTIYSLGWSPHSKQIAFAAQIDGPSSDVYVYDLDSRDIRRFSDDLPNVAHIEWSPDGQHIVYLNSFPGMVYVSRSLHVLDAEAINPARPPALFKGLFWGIEGWLSDELLIVYGSGDGGTPINGIASIDVNRQIVSELWSDAAEHMSLSPHDQTFFLWYEPWSLSSTLPAGLYRVDVHGEYVQINPKDAAAIVGRWTGVPVATSPDLQWYALEETEGKLTLYDSKHLPVRSRTMGAPIRSIIWRPDSEGMFVDAGANLVYVSVPDMNVRVVDTCRGDGCWSVDFAWLP
jgi:hypothetical protein